MIWSAIAVFLVTLTILGFQIAAFTWNQETPVMNVPTGLPYLAIPIGAAVFFVRSSHESVTVTPVVTPKQTGVAATIRF